MTIDEFIKKAKIHNASECRIAEAMPEQQPSNVWELKIIKRERLLLEALEVAVMCMNVGTGTLLRDSFIKNLKRIEEILGEK